jgi:capsular polysaccharide biosynthesis protein
VELYDYLTAIRRRLWIVLVVPLLAGVIVAALVLNGPTMYQSTATVAAPALVGGAGSSQYGGTTGFNAFAANFTAAVTSPRILAKVAATTGTASSELEEGLTAQRIGESSLIEVTFRTSHRERATAVAKAAASETIRFLFETQVTLARQTADEARKAVDKADADLAHFFAETGLVLPDKSYEVQAGQIASLEQQLLDLQARGETDAASHLVPAIRGRQQWLAKLAPKVATYRTLTERKQQALTRLDNLDLAVQQATAQYNAADPALTVTAGDAEQVSRGPDLLRKAAPAAGAGLFLAVGILIALELLSQRRRAAPTAEAASSGLPTEPAAGPAASGTTKAAPAAVRSPVAVGAPAGRATDGGNRSTGAAPAPKAPNGSVRAGRTEPEDERGQHS